MKKLLKLLLGSICFYFLVAQPLKASLFASLAMRSGIDLRGQSVLLNAAQFIEPCNVNIAKALGNTFIQMNDKTMAAIAYGKAITCSTANAQLRFTYGQILIDMGYVQGNDSIADALKLEPNNPVYKSEWNRITRYQLQ